MRYSSGRRGIYIERRKKWKLKGEKTKESVVWEMDYGEQCRDY